MSRTILASLTGLGSDHSVMETAVALGRIAGGHIRCLHTRIDAVETAALVEAASPRQHADLHGLLQKISAEEDERSRHARHAFEEARDRHGFSQTDIPVKATSISAEWKESRSFLNETLHESRYHDVTVMGRDKELSADWITGVLMQSGRPLLLAPQRPSPTIGHRVAIAWKPAAEAARAVTAASSILSQAEKVAIFSVEEEGCNGSSAQHLAEQLAWQGIGAEVHMARSTASTSQALLDAACDWDADLLVMGAYGHSRLREFVFGGVTHDLLRASVLPLFMFR